MNIIFICTDQQQARTLKIFNPKSQCITPTLDKLAKESIAFKNAYCSYTVCTPSRSSMQTGLYPSRIGMDANSYQVGCRTHELADEEYLLSRRLIKQGYQPLYTGKWHLGIGSDKEASKEGRSLLNALKNNYESDVAAYKNYGTLPSDLGFIADDFPGHGDGGWDYPEFLSYLKENNLKLEIDRAKITRRAGDHSFWGEVISKKESTIEHFITNRAISLIDDHKDKPFFISINYWGPHEPYFAPSEFLELYKDTKMQKPISFDEDPLKMPKILNQTRRLEEPWSFFENNMHYYYALMSHIDNQIKRLFDYLKKENLYDNTLIIFSSDHGDYQGAHGHLENKGYGMYEEITKIPLLLKPAIKDYKGYINDSLVGTCDIYATILDAAGIKGSYNDGRSFLGFINNKNQNWDNQIICESLGSNEIICTQRMYRKNQYKYIFNANDLDQLFDLSKDPFELDNLSLKNPELLLDLKQSFSDFLREHKDALYASFSKINFLNEWKL